MTPLFGRRPLRGLLAAAALALSACKDNAPPPPAALVAVGDFQFTATVAERIPSALTVRVNDATGNPVTGVPVTFAVAEGGGSLSRLVDTTKAGGLATTNWTLGERAGTQRVTATALGVAASIDFTATAKAGAPATIAVNGGNTQSVVAGTAVLTAPSVIIKDRFTNPVPGVSVIFSVASGGGSITGGGATSNAAGIAAVTEWKMGPSVGANSLSALALASGVTGNPVTFTATATAGTPAAVTAQGSTTLTGVVFTSVAPVPSVKVTDANGNAVAGASVTFTGSAGSTVAGGTKTTDANGVASPDAWQLGTQARAYTLSATVGSIPAVVFTATARAGAATTMTAVAGNNQSVQAGRPVPVEPSVRVTDIHGNPVAGIDVLFEVGSGGGSAVGRRAATDATGTATVGGWTLGDAVGANTLVASVVTSGVSVPAVTFTATATAGAASTMTASAGQNQSAQAGSAVAVAPAVVVRDVRGNPVIGVSVTFSVGSGGGALTGPTVITNASGVAAVGSWTLGGSVGTQTLVARSGSLPEVTFTANATAGAASYVTAWSPAALSNIAAGSALGASQRPAVKVTDSQGNPVPGATVTFTLAADGTSGSVGTSLYTTTATSNSNGIATVGTWTVPTTVGTATMTASVSGLTDVVTFTVTTVAGPAATMTPLVSTSMGNILIGASFAAGVLPSVRLTDVYGNPVSGVTVTFAALGAAGTLGAQTAVTNASGTATLSSWTVSTSLLGSASVTATYGILTSIFSGTVIASASQSSASAAASVALSAPTTVTVNVRDGSGNLIAAAGTSSFTAAITASTGAGTGTLGAFSCSAGVCIAQFTAPATAGSATIEVRIGGVLLTSGGTLTITYP